MRQTFGSHCGQATRGTDEITVEVEALVQTSLGLYSRGASRRTISAFQMLDTRLKWPMTSSGFQKSQRHYHSLIMLPDGLSDPITLSHNNESHPYKQYLLTEPSTSGLRDLSCNFLVFSISHTTASAALWHLKCLNRLGKVLLWIHSPC